MSADPAKVTFQVGDIARNLQTNEQRYVIDVVGDALFVLADESKGKHSSRRQWLASNCTLVTPCPFHIHDKVALGNKTDVVGEIVEIKPHYNGKWLMFCVERPNPNGGTMTHWANEGALRLASTSSVLEEVKSVGDKMKDTESAADDIPAPDSFSRDLLMRAAQELADEQEKTIAADRHIEDLERQLLEARREAKMLEKRYVDLQGMVTTRQPIPVQQTECYQIKTVPFKVGLPDHDKQYAEYLNDGWKENSVTSVITSGDAIICVVVFKKMLNTPPSQPTRGSAEHHAELTGDFVRQSVETRRVTPQPVTPDAILEPISQLADDAEYLGSYRALFRAGASLDDVIDLSNRSALESAFARSRARIDAMPAFNRPLHSLKASN